MYLHVQRLWLMIDFIPSLLIVSCFVWFVPKVKISRLNLYCWKPAILQPHWWYCQSRWLTQDQNQVGENSLEESSCRCWIASFIPDQMMDCTPNNWFNCYLHSMRSNSDSFSESLAFKSRMSLWREKETNSSHRGISALPLSWITRYFLSNSFSLRYNFESLPNPLPRFLLLLVENTTEYNR